MLPIRPYKTQKQIIQELAEKHNLSEKKVNAILIAFFGRPSGLGKGIRYQYKMLIKGFGVFKPNSKGNVLARNRFNMYVLTRKIDLEDHVKRKKRKKDNP